MLSSSQSKRASEAYNEAVKSPCYHKHGCVISCSGRIIGRGFNTNRTQSADKIIDCCASCHAEIAAIRDAIKNKRMAFRAKEVPGCKLSGWSQLHSVCGEGWRDRRSEAIRAV